MPSSLEVHSVRPEETGLRLPASMGSDHAIDAEKSSRTKNLMLEALREEDAELVRASLEEVALPMGTEIYKEGVAPEFAYFITDGIASITAEMKDGSVVEVGVVGAEGLAGADWLLGPLPITTQCTMQIGGSGQRIAFEVLENLFQEAPSLRARVLEQIQHSLNHSRQLAACNALHSVAQRLARWLLVIQDRMKVDQFALTHEFLAAMVSAHRPTVSLVAANLQREGIISYRHGNVKIMQRENLEHAACECYLTMRDSFNRLYR